MNVTAVPFEELQAAWHLAAPHLKEAVAMSGGRYSMRALYETIAAQKAVLWLIVDDTGAVVAACTTHVAHYPLKDILAVDFVGGTDVGDWLASLVETLGRFVTAQQLDGLETVARLGWKPRLAALGWKQSMAFYERGLA